MNEFESIRSRVEDRFLGNYTSSLFDLIPIGVMYIIDDKTWLNPDIRRISSMRSDILREIDRVWFLHML